MTVLGWAIAVLYTAAAALVWGGSALLAEGARDPEMRLSRVGGVIAVVAGLVVALGLTFSLTHPAVSAKSLLALKGEAHER